MGIILFVKMFFSDSLVNNIVGILTVSGSKINFKGDNSCSIDPPFLDNTLSIWKLQTSDFDVNGNSKVLFGDKNKNVE